MQALFLLTVALGGAYLLWARRRFDLFSAAFFSACVYFLPGFFGYALMPATKDSFDRLPSSLVPETYTVFVAVLTAIVLGAVLLDRLLALPPAPESSARPVGGPRLPGGAVAVWVALALAVLGFLGAVAEGGSALLSPLKAEVMTVIGRPYILWTTAASVAAVLAFVERRLGLLALALALLLADVYIGFRSALATTAIALFTLALGGRGPQRLSRIDPRTAALGVFAGLFFFVYKFFFKTIKGGYWWQLEERIADPSYILKSFTESEPFATQVILNEVLRHDFHIPFSALSGVFYQLIVFSPALGAKQKAFFDFFQPELFPEARAGMAGNIWAQMWSAGGWPLMLLFLGVFTLLLFAGSWLLARWRDPKLRAAVALLGSYWAFYLHRNDLAYAINLEKRIVFIWGACALAALAVVLIRARLPTWWRRAQAMMRSRRPEEAGS